MVAQRYFMLVLFGAALLTGCKPKLLAGTSIEENAQNKAVAQFVEEYRMGIEARSIDAIMALVAQDYFSDGMNREQVDAKLTSTFERTKEITISVYIQEVRLKNGLIEVIYKFNQRALLDLPSGEKWVSFSDINRLTIRQKGRSIEDGFEIVGGL